MSKIYYKPNRKDGDDETAATTGVDSAARAVPEANADTKPAAQSRDGAGAANSVAERPEARRRRPPRPTNTEIYDESATAEAVADTSVAAEITAEVESGQSGAARMEPSPGFDKDKIIRYFKRHPNKAVSATKVERFSPEISQGLNQRQVEERFRQFLFNDTNKKYSKSYASIFVSNICTFFNLLCLCAFIALLIAGTTGITNYLVIIITSANIILGIIQEIRSKKSIDKLSILATSTSKVIRDGELVEIPSSEIVMDDILILELGNQVPADCILAEGSVEVNESLLTGESIAIKKQPGDILYAGSFIASGSGKFRVEKVGRDTYLEKLTAKAKKYRRPNSELMNSTKMIIKAVGFLIVPIAIGMFFTTYNAPLSDTALSGVFDYIFPAEVNYAIQRTCTVVIGMIPSGMMLLTTMALAVGVIRLAKNNTLVQDLYSLEMLARVNVLCLDKTGTITDGRMRVSDCVILNTVGEYSLNDIMGSMLSALDDNNQTSIALYNHFGHNYILSPTAKIPFSSKRKLSAVTFEDVGTFVMGAPEFVLKPLPAKVDRIVKQYATMGLRVIVLAHSATPIVGDKLPSVLKPVAIISIADNIREDAVDTIKWFRHNDVAVKVISGDNPVTVAEVARRAGIENADKFISLEGLNDKEVESVANKYTVFGRVTPEQKAVLVRAIKSEGNTVAMTGDGVNDILALKEADCAISVASGSEAARNVSHLVLMDNNFASMPKVVGEGRRVINNIKNSSSLYLMKTLFTAILAVICMLILQQPYLFMPSNMLLLEVCIIGAPSFMLSLQPNKERVQGKFITHVMSRSIPGAVLMICCVMAMYLVYVFNPAEFEPYYVPMCMMAMTFAGLIMLYRVCQPFNGYRLVLFCCMVGATAVALSVPAIGDMLYKVSDEVKWSTLHWDYTKFLIIAVAIEAAFPLSNSLIKIMQILLPSSTGKKPEVLEIERSGQ
ncbi:MAG TPA: HAD-IC family P-type ATPase [Candidatus Coproplasma excrementipullorum]|nr:HAD-IC family P-type ATPase [Candidatus Coproplasma excrementipullorum]